jgi:hypothetical protein
MTNNLISASFDRDIEVLKKSRKRPAVLKAELALLRSALPKCIVFAYEGDTDKSVYAQWVRRVKNELVFEPFPCDGKKQLFLFRDMLDRDLGNLREGVYYFFDRDFDGMCGRELGSHSFITDRYSIENYLVDGAVLEELLKNEFHCHAKPEVRSKVVELFEDCLRQFLAVTKDLNFRVFLARRLKIEVLGGLPKKAKDIANVALLGVSKCHQDPCQIVRLAREPTTDEMSGLLREFEDLDARLHYRGKFAFSFFLKWLSLLAEDRFRDQPITFKGVEKKKAVNFNELSAAVMASRSPLPVGFFDFVNSIEAA